MKTLKNLIKKIISITGYKITKIIKPPSTKEKKTNYYIKKLSDDYKEHTPLKLHFGCGPRILKNWINIDLSYCHYENYLKYYTEKFYPKKIRGTKNDFYEIDITKTGLPLPNNSVDVIFHEDLIEHLDQKNQIIFLSETLRILKKRAIHRVNTPNLLPLMREESNFQKGQKGVCTYQWDKWRHFNILTPKILEEIALMVGYSKVLFNNRDKSTSKNIPLEYRPASPNNSNDHKHIFADLIK